MEWARTPSGETVGVLNSFLKTVKVKSRHAGDKASTYNKLLKKAGHVEKLRRVKLEHRPGSDPWVGSKSLFTVLYKAVSY